LHSVVDVRRHEHNLEEGRKREKEARNHASIL
jgi:hypothetical protein